MPSVKISFKKNCVCVCVCARAKEKEAGREREKERGRQTDRQERGERLTD